MTVTAHEPRKVVGTVNAAEFVVAVAASMGFLAGIAQEDIPWSAVLGLVIGGVIVAPSPLGSPAASARSDGCARRWADHLGEPASRSCPRSAGSRRGWTGPASSASSSRPRWLQSAPGDGSGWSVSSPGRSMPWPPRTRRLRRHLLRNPQRCRRSPTHRLGNRKRQASLGSGTLPRATRAAASAQTYPRASRVDPRS